MYLRDNSCYLSYRSVFMNFVERMCCYADTGLALNEGGSWRIRNLLGFLLFDFKVEALNNVIRYSISV